MATAWLLALTAAAPWRRPLRRVVFNIGADGVALGTAARVLAALGGPGTDLVGVVAALLLYSIVDVLVHVGVDSKTGLLTLAGFTEHVLKERRRRGQQLLALAMIDIDRFRAVNTEHGHLVGDRVLQAVAEAIRGQSRPYDVVARSGGEDVVALADLDDEELRAVCERLRRAVHEETTPHAAVTASIGVFRWEEGQTLDAALQAADDALYEATSSGRDQVCLATLA